MDRNQFIQQAIDSGVKVPNLSPALQEAGFEPLSKSEQLIIEQGNFGKNAWQHYSRNEGNHLYCRRNYYCSERLQDRI